MKKVITILIAAWLMIILPFSTALAVEETIDFGDNITATLDTETGVLTVSGNGAMGRYAYNENNTPTKPYRDQITTVVIEEGITEICNYAFVELTNLTSVTIPSSVTRIGAYAFGLCSSLESIDIPNKVEIIEFAAFCNCSSITSVVIPESVTFIGYFAFANCENLTSAVISESVTYIEHNAFKNCSNLATITNLYEGTQTLEENVLLNAGTNVESGERVVYAMTSNTTFTAAAVEAGYQIREITNAVESTIPMNGTVSAITISVTHPASVAYTIDPNLEMGTFVAPDIAITNNTKVAVNVSVKSLDSASGGTLQFTDVATDAKEWATLDLEDSKSFIALGVKIDNTDGWNSGYNTDTHYAVDTESTLLGSLDTDATGHMIMTANHGLAFDCNYTALHNLIFMFDLT